MKLQINLCALALLLMIPFTAMAQSKTKAKAKAKKEVAIQLYSVRDILNKVDNKDGKCDAAYITLLKNLAKMGYICRAEGFILTLHKRIVERRISFR